MQLTEILTTDTSIIVILSIALFAIIALFILRFRKNLVRFKKSYDEILLHEYGYVERLADIEINSSRRNMDFESAPVATRMDSRLAKSSDLLKTEFASIKNNQKNGNHEKMLTLIDDCLFSLKKSEKGVQTCQHQSRILVSLPCATS
jgi:hypothetical protein